MIEKRKTTYKIKLILIQIDGGGTHLAIRAGINGEKVVFLIDTGASNSVFDVDDRVFGEIEMSPVDENGTSSGFNSELPQIVTGEIKSIKIGRLEMRNKKVLFTTMQHINNLYKKLNLPRITGIIGSDMLLEHNAVIDFGSRLILLEKK